MASFFMPAHGIMEWWNHGMMGLGFTQYSIIPLFSRCKRDERSELVSGNIEEIFHIVKYL
jgi:hypothetical protein